MTGVGIVLATNFFGLILVIVGRYYVRESDRFRHLHELRQARRARDEAQVRSLLQRYDVDVGALEAPTLRQLFAQAGELQATAVKLMDRAGYR